MAKQRTGRPEPKLNLFDSTNIIVGIIIGVGIFETTPLIASQMPGLSWLVGVWLLGGLMALIGALCYAELASTYPQQGGDYVFLTRGYGRRTGFMFAWFEFWIVRPGSIGAMAFVFARYFHQLLGLRPDAWALLSATVMAIVVLTALNVLGVRSGKTTQNVLTVVKVGGLLAIFVASLFLLPHEDLGPQAPGEAAFPWSGFGLAMILVMFTYGGWNDVSYVAAEVKRPERNILRALLVGVGLVTVVYVMVNIALVRGLGWQQMISSDGVAADLLDRAIGPRGGQFISALICVSALGAINGMIFTGARVYYALGTEHPLYSWLGTWHARRGIPLRSLLLQGAATVFLVVVIGRDEHGFARLVVVAAPFFWFFFLLAGISLFVLRVRDRQRPRVYRVPLFPLTPVLFCLICLFMLYSSASYAMAEEPVALPVLAIVVLASGLILSWITIQPGKNSHD